jgi:hypothetical protein
MDQVWDPAGEAGSALARVVEGFGPQVLGRADMLDGLLQDDIPQLPREAALLTAAARAGVAELLAERVGQGISPQAAVSMAATEMTARTAVDASGAPWAAGVFARVLGYPVQQAAVRAAAVTRPADLDPTITDRPADAPPAVTPPVLTPPVVRKPGSADAGAEPTRRITDPDRETIVPASDQGLTLPRVAETRRGLATAVAAAAAVAAPMPLLWCAVASADGVLSSFFAVEDFWLSAAFLAAALAGLAVWSARGWRGGAGFAAIVGIAVPGIAVAVFFTALAAELTSLPGKLRGLLELVSVLWLAATLLAAALGVAGLIRHRQLARAKPAAVPAFLAAAGVGYALANILAQGQDDGQLLFNALGPGVHGWFIVSGIVFIGLTAVPPLLAAFLLPSAGGRAAVLTGWLLFALSNQVGEIPTNGISAEPGLYLTWVLWIAVLAGTLMLTARRKAGPTDARTA